MFNVINLKQLCSVTKMRRKPNCYLFSNMTILISFFLLCAYFLTMNMILISNIKNRGPYHPLKQPTNTKLILNSITNAETSTNPKQIYVENKSFFWNLPVKKIMMADATHFLRSPIAELVEYVFNFSEFFPFITANTVSFLHNILSIVSIRYLAHDSLVWRQFGVCIFQFRNFLDSFDGVLYRAHAKKNEYKSNYGSFGYFVDAISDTFGGICLVIAITLYFYKHPPLHTKYTKCIKLIETNQDCGSKDQESSPTCKKNIMLGSSSYNNQFEAESSYIYSQLDNKESQQNFEENNSQHLHKSNMQASRLVVLVSVAMLGIRIAVSALFWDRSVHNYQDLLDIVPNSLVHQNVQVIIIKSNLTILIMVLWRFFNALYLQDLILAAIFIDKTWEFIVKTQVIGWLLLIILIIATELHVAQISSILSVIGMLN